ncbi:MAG: type 1 glutamine amidotransferase [Actinobacteria bacterium]|nr:type 1 glutamine amidotransferase [Actinomycetota bacterium]
MKPLTIVQHEPDDPPGSIAVALREFGAPFAVCRPDQGEALPAWPDETSGIVSLGGAMHVTDTHRYPWLSDEIRLMRRMVHEGAPVWGICLGAQLLTIATGGDVYRRKRPEVGWTRIEKVHDDPLLRGISSPFVAFNWHEYSCKVSPTSHVAALCGNGVQVFRAGGRSWGTQFHPEVDAAMAPHWVRDAIKEQKQLGDAFAAELRAETEARLPGYPAFCRRLTENFLRTAGLLDP